MSDHRDPNDPLWRDGWYEPPTRGQSQKWGWIAGILVLAVLIAIVFGVRHPTQLAYNDTSQTSHLAAPPTASTHQKTALPGLTPPPVQGSGLAK
jgi:hypothetical protein